MSKVAKGERRNYICRLFRAVSDAYLRYGSLVEATAAGSTLLSASFHRLRWSSEAMAAMAAARSWERWKQRGGAAAVSAGELSETHTTLHTPTHTRRQADGTQRINYFNACSPLAALARLAPPFAPPPGRPLVAVSPPNSFLRVPFIFRFIFVYFRGLPLSSLFTSVAAAWPPPGRRTHSGRGLAGLSETGLGVKRVQGRGAGCAAASSCIRTGEGEKAGEGDWSGGCRGLEGACERPGRGLEGVWKGIWAEKGTGNVRGQPYPGAGGRGRVRWMRDKGRMRGWWRTAPDGAKRPAAVYTPSNAPSTRACVHTIRATTSAFAPPWPGRGRGPFRGGLWGG